VLRGDGLLAADAYGRGQEEIGLKKTRHSFLGLLLAPYSYTLARSKVIITPTFHLRLLDLEGPMSHTRNSKFHWAYFQAYFHL
jgi:hypothetical protein